MKPTLDEFYEQAGIDSSYFDSSGYDHYYPNLYGAEMLLEYSYTLSAGGVYDTDSLLTMISTAAITQNGENLSDNLDAALWNGQAANVFLPANIVAVSAKSTQKDAAKSVVSFLFSDEGQSISTSDGFPVTASAYDSFWELGEEGTEVLSYSVTNGSTSVDVTVTVPAQDVLDKYKSLGTSLTTPASGNQIVLDAVKDAGIRYLNGEATLDEAVDGIQAEVSLYLAE